MLLDVRYCVFDQQEGREYPSFQLLWQGVDHGNLHTILHSPHEKTFSHLRDLRDHKIHGEVLIDQIQ